MYLLEREISPYTGANLCLGVFDSREAAEIAKARYQGVSAENDPWRAQAYREVDLATDVRIVEIEVVGHPETELHLVSAYYEGFGQCVRRFVILHAQRDAADAHALALQEQESETEEMANECEVETLVINRLLFPSPE
jgi:hypothetical protein